MRLPLCFSAVSPSPLSIPKSGREREPEQGGCQAVGPALLMPAGTQLSFLAAES